MTIPDQQQPQPAEWVREHHGLNRQALYEVLKLLPPPGTIWPKADRERWLAVFTAVLNYLIDVREPVPLTVIKSKPRSRRKWTDERREKFSASAKGRPVSEETRRKLSAAMKAKGIVPPWRRPKVQSDPAEDQPS